MSDEAARLIERFAWRGFTVINFCPGCMRPIISVKLMKLIGKVWRENPPAAIRMFDSVYSVACFAFFIPGSEEQAQLLNRRYVIYPICYECASKVGSPGFLERIEENIIMARRNARIFKHNGEETWLCGFYL